MKQTIGLLFLAVVAFVAADVYMHNPRGSNDRLNEANTNRNNGNRLFDSQNNAKGGYCVGPPMTFYEGSLLSVEWTAQHGCGSNPKMVCNIVIQYMCGKNDDDPMVRIRDGETTDTIQDDPDSPNEVDDDTGNLKFGMHESYQYYQDCKTRDRNLGLYVADRASEGGLTPDGRPSARFTRQNNNGNRNGYECPEERDYYPYWHPSPWKDVAILASNKDFCKFYKKESQNVKPKGYCVNPDTDAQSSENTPSECNKAGNTWTEAPAHGIDAPECVEAGWSRENHLGNGADGFANRFNMTIPKGEACAKDGKCSCVLRLRYNISTIEDGYPSMSNPDSGFIDSNNNDDASPVQEDPEIPLENGGELALAVDTSQFGRTFQDRSHTFAISPRPKGVPKNARLFNLNVRGKRGNIVQTYPSTEYDFVPQYLYTRVGDFIHFQWTGCDTNPAGNAGEGTDQTDRSNMVQIENAASSVPVSDDWARKHPKKVLFQDAATRLRFATLDQENCELLEDILSTNGNNEGNAEQDVRNCGKLNAAEQYFNGGVLKMNNTGTFHYMNTRNHNFSNRDQKGIIYVLPYLPNWALAIVIVGSVLFVGAAAVAGLMVYAKQHPHSPIANVFSKM